MSKWENCVLVKNHKFSEFWRDYLLKNKKISLIIAVGFDPRATSCLSELSLCLNEESNVELICIEYDYGNCSSHVQQDNGNMSNVDEICKAHQGKMSKKVVSVKMCEQDELREMRIGHYEIIRSLSMLELENNEHILLDVSSLSRSMFFSALGFLLPKYLKSNIHVITSENVEYDKNISCRGVNELAYVLPGYLASYENSDIDNVVWIPVIGENQGGRLKAIYETINPTEICPVLPSPSKNPRRGDEILLSYRELIFDTWNVEQINIVYASEINPVDVYMQIVKAAKHYTELFGILDGTKIVISALSSKLMSIGAFMAAYELNAGGTGIHISVVNADCQEYFIEPIDVAGLRNELYSVWLSGDPYEQ